jgi:predicted NUDIX family NTP pyrophosphohydrolase
VKSSAGLLLVRRASRSWEFLLAHPGGPLWSFRDDGAWTVPKGAPEPDESLSEAAVREFEEETGFSVDRERFAREAVALGEVRQKGGKRVHVWMLQGEVDPAKLVSNTFELQWPPKSGRVQRFPEVDAVAFFDPQTARRKILAAQAVFVDRALAELDARG